MSSATPITLRGDSLGERHRHLNSLVQDAYNQKLPLETILGSPESSPIDKLYKIELASKHRNVEYISKCLQQDNMLYVSRALKCTWLLDSQYQTIINPRHLECELYPHMISPAVNKMKHWLHINLRDHQRCREFYEYYSNDYDMKIKFLCHCTPDFIKTEFLNVIGKVTPKHLTILCQYCPQVIKLFYENFSKNSEALKRYLKNQRVYFKCSKYILKEDPDSYFDIVEKYYDYTRLGTLSPVITEHVMKRHKQRFVEKPELYAARLLDKYTLAKHLSNEEIKELVLKLARAEYLDNWFSYKSVEPFIKRLSLDERAVFKKKVFVDKDIGSKVKVSPYPKISRPETEDLDTVFDDIKYRPEDYKFKERDMFKRCLKKRKCMYSSKMQMDYVCEMKCGVFRRKTLLDELFDRYRFLGFDQTMTELRKQLAAESSVKKREFMMLVLVSKCGENMSLVEKLTRFLVERHNNEPSNLRATVVRSMVVRACVWRLPPDAWKLILDFGRDVGLEGVAPLICVEGMHASVLRALLSGEECPVALRTAFVDNFSSLTEYKLSVAEKRLVGERLPALLLAIATAETSSSVARDRLQLLLDALSSLKIKVNNCAGAVGAIVEAVRRDSSAAADLLRRVYNERVARPELFLENFKLFQTNESYMNVLRHNATLLNSTKEFEESLKSHSFNYNGFLRKLALYFGEKNGLAAVHADAINKIMTDEPHACLARPLALLRADVDPLIIEYMKEPKRSPKKQLAAALQANYHLCNVIDVDARDWRTIGAKAVANRLLTCKAMDLDRYIQKSLQWRRTLKLALILAERRKNVTEVYSVVCTKRPGSALRSALSYFKRNSNNEVEIEVWSAVAPALAVIDLSIEQHRFLRKSLDKAEYVPAGIRAEYWTDVFKAFQKISKEKTGPILCRLENLLPEVDKDIIKKVIEEFLEDFTLEMVSGDDYHHNLVNCMKVRIVAKYLLLSKNYTEQKERLEDIWQPFHDRVSSLLKQNTACTMTYINEFVKALKYHGAFFNTTVSCSPVLERIVTDLRKSLPMEGFFQTFVLIHATMLCYNSIETCLKQYPEKFGDAKKKQIEGVNVVANLFGGRVGKELRELTSKYFKSIITLYQDNLMIILRDQIKYSASRTNFITAFVKGLIEVGNTEALRVAEHVLAIDGCDDPERREFLNRLKESDDEEVKFFLYAGVYSGSITGSAPPCCPIEPRFA